MKTQSGNNARLGIFIVAGLFALMFSLYIIGSNRSVFGSNFELKIHFNQLNGLEEGNNVLFSGIQAGTVKSVRMIGDTTIEVVLIIDNKIKSYIHKNAEASIGSEGLMGNKVINIANVPGYSPTVSNGDLIAAHTLIGMDAMIVKLAKTNDNVEIISEVLKKSILKVDNGTLVDLLSDKHLGQSIKNTFTNAELASANAKEMTHDLDLIVRQAKNGKGLAGMLLTDTAYANSFKATLAVMKAAGINANHAASQANELVTNLNTEINSGNGTLHVLLKDTVMAGDLKSSMANVKKGTAGFDENMEALQHNFLLRGFFKRREKQRQDSLKKLQEKK